MIQKDSARKVVREVLLLVDGCPCRIAEVVSAMPHPSEEQSYRLIEQSIQNHEVLGNHDFELRECIGAYLASVLLVVASEVESMHEYIALLGVESTLQSEDDVIWQSAICVLVLCAMRNEEHLNVINKLLHSLSRFVEHEWRIALYIAIAVVEACLGSDVAARRYLNEATMLSRECGLGHWSESSAECNAMVYWKRVESDGDIYYPERSVRLCGAASCCET